MTEDEIKGRLTEVFRVVFQNNTLRLYDEMKASDVPSWDSLNNVKLVISIEQEFGVRFNLREINSLQNVGELLSLIEEKLRPAGL